MIADPLHRANDNHFDHANEVDFTDWAEKIKARYSYFDKSSGHNLGAWTRRTPHNGEEFRWLVKQDDDSGIPSPPLWDNVNPSPPMSTTTSGAQVMARYRKEMMDLVRDAPESAYELSLKDIVELPRSAGRAAHESPVKGKKGARRAPRSMDGGIFLLRMFLPSSLGRKMGRSHRRSSKATSNPILGDRETNSSSGSSSAEGWKLGGCLSFFCPHKSRRLRRE